MRLFLKNLKKILTYRRQCHNVYDLKLKSTKLFKSNIIVLLAYMLPAFIGHYHQRMVLTYARETTMKSSQFQASRRYVNLVSRKPRAVIFTRPSMV